MGAEARAAANLGLRVVHVRTGIVLGREGGALKQMLPPFRLGVGGPTGSGKQWMSWIHIDDLVEAIVFTLGEDSFWTGERYVAQILCATRSSQKRLARPWDGRR